MSLNGLMNEGIGPVSGKLSICAHAGCEGSDPDSLESVAAAIRAGADVVEVDVRFTEDGIAVLSHDALSGESGYRPACLKDALKLVAATPNMKVNLDLKVHEGISSLSALLDKTRMTGRAFFTGMEPQNVATVRAQCPQVPFAIDYSKKWLPFRGLGYLRSILEEARDSGAFAFNLEYHSLTGRFMELCAKEMFPVHVWTVDTEPAMRRMIDLGVSSITTRKVSALKGLL